VRDRFVWIGVAAYAVIFTLLGWVKYAVHRNLVDFGIFAQTAASAFGCFCNPIEGSHWAFHFSPILYVAGAALAAWKSPLTLIALQALACALVAPPIYAIVRARADAGTARLAALVVWLYPPLAGLAFGDFHENGFAPAAVVWMLWALDAGYLVAAAALAAVVLAVKEDQAIFLTAAGFLGYGLFRRSDVPRARLALGVACASLIVLTIYFFLIQPHAGANPNWQPTRFYAWSAGDMAMLPIGVLERFGFLGFVFVPLLFVPLRSKWMLLAILPLAEVLFSRMPTTFTLGTHYTGAWIGYVLVAFAMGLSRLSGPIRTRLLYVSLAICALVFLFADPLHPGLNLRRIEARDIALDRFLTTLPSDLDVATQEEAYTHLALTDSNATLLPEPDTTVNACNALTDTDFPQSARLEENAVAPGRRPALLQRAIVTRQTGGIALYRVPGCRLSAASDGASSSSASAAGALQPGSARTTR
jgi:uncharacterized membrane protein